jgi:hypothetical protein
MVPIVAVLAQHLVAIRPTPRADNALVCPPTRRKKNNGTRGAYRGTHLGEKSIRAALARAFRATASRPPISTTMAATRSPRWPRWAAHRVAAARGPRPRRHRTDPGVPQRPPTRRSRAPSPQRSRLGSPLSRSGAQTVPAARLCR